MLLQVVRGLLFRIASAITALAIRMNYVIVRRRIRRRKQDEKIRVLFLVNEPAKWKTQSLYDLMEKSDAYEPMIGITIMDMDGRLSDESLQKKINETEAYFKDKKARLVCTYDIRTKSVVPVRDVGADIVVYQQPYVIPCEHKPDYVSFGALTCYVPYYVTNYGTRSFDYGFDFHRQVWRYFILNEDYAKAYRRFGWLEGYSGRILGLGHTGLDYYHLHSEQACDENIVIYAPHWSFDHPRNNNPENYSTFLWSGRAILDYAQHHPEFKWVFRPHPTLRFALERSGAWSISEIDSYWREWERIAIISRNDDYQGLFLRSKALITDCGSFLIEYFVTGKPVIHLISSTVKVKPIASAKRYFDSWYKVRNQNEMDEVFKTVLENGQDPQKDERKALLCQSGLLNNYAARRILDYISKELSVATE